MSSCRFTQNALFVDVCPTAVYCHIGAGICLPKGDGWSLQTVVNEPVIDNWLDMKRKNRGSNMYNTLKNSLLLLNNLSHYFEQHVLT